MSLVDLAATESVLSTEDGRMVEAPARARERRVEKIPALLVAMMKDADKLPQPARMIEPGQFGFRFPTLADMMTLEWAAEWDAAEFVDAQGMREAKGIMSYRDQFDFHSSSDVREICYVAGTPRALVHLFRWVRSDAAKVGRRVIGSFDQYNASLVHMLERLGASQTRVVVEAPV